MFAAHAKIQKMLIFFSLIFQWWIASAQHGNWDFNAPIFIQINSYLSSCCRLDINDCDSWRSCTALPVCTASSARATAPNQLCRFSSTAPPIFSSGRDALALKTDLPNDIFPPRERSGCTTPDPSTELMLQPPDLCVANAFRVNFICTSLAICVWAMLHSVGFSRTTSRCGSVPPRRLLRLLHPWSHWLGSWHRFALLSLSHSGS